MANPPGNPNIRNIGFGSRPRAVDDEYRSRQKGVPHKRKWTKEKCIIQLEEIMDLLKKKVENDDFKQLEIIINKMMDIIKYLYPPVQQSKNLNLNLSRVTSAENVNKIFLEIENERGTNNTISGTEDQESVDK